MYLEKNDTYELPNAYDDDGAKLLFWTTLKEAKWDSEPQEGEIRVHTGIQRCPPSERGIGLSDGLEIIKAIKEEEANA